MAVFQAERRSQRAQSSSLQCGPGDIVIGVKMDRLFRSAADALCVIEHSKKRRISMWLLDLSNDCSGNGISELIVTVLAAVAQFERIKDVKRNVRRSNRHQGGSVPFGFKLGEANGHDKARELVEDPAEQHAIATMRKMRARGRSLMAIREAVRARGHKISHETVRNILQRAAEEGAA